METNSDLKCQAMKRAIEIYEEIMAAKTPKNAVTGEVLKIYEEFEEWEFLDNFPMSEDKNRWLYIRMIALQQYRHMKWKRDHPSKQVEKKSKWQVVHGKVAKGR
jgi:hypothetical protein